MNAKSISLRVCIAIAAATLFAACSGSENTDTGNPTATQNAAVDMFWRALHNNDYAHIGDAQAALRAAIDQNPNSAELYAPLGATHWWHAGEASRDSRPDPNVLSTDLPTALQLSSAT